MSRSTDYATHPLTVFAILGGIWARVATTIEIAVVSAVSAEGYRRPETTVRTGVVDRTTTDVPSKNKVQRATSEGGGGRHPRRATIPLIGGVKFDELVGGNAGGAVRNWKFPAFRADGVWHHDTSRSVARGIVSSYSSRPVVIDAAILWGTSRNDGIGLSVIIKPRGTCRTHWLPAIALGSSGVQVSIIFGISCSTV